MAKIIDFPVKDEINIDTCGQCKKYDSCYAESNKLLGRTNTDDYEECKKIPACDKISL